MKFAWQKSWGGGELLFSSRLYFPVVYKGDVLDKEFRMDFLVDNKVIVELKAVEKILPIHEAQIISYLKMADMRLGLLINFNVPLLKEGFQRFANNL